MSFKPLSLWSPNPSTGERGTAVKLNSNKKDSLVYAVGRSIFIKNIDKLDSSTYTGHVHPTTVAKFSPSGFYVASGDVTGSVRVWDVVGEDQVMKVEVKAIAGRINDIAWDSDSGGKRIIAVGEGRERYGHAFSVDGGNSVGEIAGHSKPVRAVAIRPARPFRAVTASDDTTLAFFEGTPYKFNKTIRTHTKFVNTVEYAHDGGLFASGGSDSKIFIYDGATGEKVSELGGDGSAEKHSGTVYSISWSISSGSTLASFSADGTVKMWDASSQKHVRSWTLASSPTSEEQQVGGAWLEGNRLVSLAYNGDLTILDDRQPEPIKKIYANQKGIIAASKSPTGSGIYAGDYSGRMLYFSHEGVCKPLEIKSGSNIIGLSSSKSKVFSVGMDDVVREIDPSTVAYNTSSAIPLPEQSKGISARSDDDIALVVTSTQARLVESGNSLVTHPLEFSAAACALSCKFAAIGSTDGKVYVYDVSSKTLEKLAVLENNKSSVTCIRISPDEQHVAVGEQSGKIMVYELSAGYGLKISSQWCWHSAKIWSLSWSKCSNFLLSCSLDTNIYVWSLAKPMKNIPIKNAHVGGTTEVVWETETTFISCGADGGIRRFSVDLDKLK